MTNNGHSTTLDVNIHPTSVPERSPRVHRVAPATPLGYHLSTRPLLPVTTTNQPTKRTLYQ
ncbi:hypothetical protein M413DRAFT_442157 [Hebeloma cylindrosporum]|uniref:Uncharacterized protein n=1 Tax=Hebeloma cylindrosporum TaxID=76867 RepID=A0A0C3CNU3_HEBCY|nr:hypothetical protein M413DRAFT_442157 [Hebeloma cylindrosporum h7]